MGGFSLEIIAVDDCSTDKSCEVIENIKDDKIILKRQHTNMGPAAARNVGINLATGEYLAFLDADDYWKPEFLLRTVTFLENHPECVAVSVGQIHKRLGKPDSIAPKICNFPNSTELVIEDFWQFWAEHNHICTGSALIRTSTAKQTGGQREDLRIFEDWEYWGLVSQYGKWGFIPDILFVSDGGAVTKEQGWIRKHKIRWQNTPTLKEWSKRLSQQDTQIPINKSYDIFLQNLTFMLSYNMLMAGLYRKSFNNLKENKIEIVKNKLFKLLKHASSYNYIYWLIISVSLRNIQNIRHLMRTL